VSLGLLLGAVETGALENNVNTDLAPRQLSSVCLCIDGQGLAVDSDGTSLIVSGNGVKVLTDDAAVALLRSIILEQVSEHRRLGQVVDCDDLVTLSAEHLTESQTTDTAETIDSNFNRHWNYLLNFDTSILHHFYGNCKHFDKKITLKMQKARDSSDLHINIEIASANLQGMPERKREDFHGKGIEISAGL
jgi:hypothetical protein